MDENRKLDEAAEILEDAVGDPLLINETSDTKIYPKLNSNTNSRIYDSEKKISDKIEAVNAAQITPEKRESKDSI